MKPQLKKAVALDRTNCFVADAIRYLDSPTDYRECLHAGCASDPLVLLDEQDIPVLERLVVGLLFRLSMRSRVVMTIVSRLAGLR